MFMHHFQSVLQLMVWLCQTAKMLLGLIKTLILYANRLAYTALGTLDDWSSVYMMSELARLETVLPFVVKIV